MFFVKKIVHSFFFIFAMMGVLWLQTAQVQAATIVTYPVPSVHSTSGSMTLKVDGVSVPSIRFQDATDVEYYYAHFSYSSSDTITLQVTATENISTYKIRPEAYNLAGTVNAKTLTFTLSQPRYLTVEINSLKKLIILADELEQNAPPSSGTGIYNIQGSPYNADATGNTLATTAIQNAIDDANSAGGGTVYVPAGVYQSGNIYLKSNVTLYLEGGSVIRGTGNAADYTSPDVPTYSDPRTQFISTALGATNIKITGRGMIDSNGKNLLNNYQWKIMGLVPVQVSGLTIDGIIMRDSSYWSLVVGWCDNVVIQNVKVLNSEFGYENDGIDICGSQNVNVKHCFTYTNDDSLSTKTWDVGQRITALWGTGPAEPCQDVIFEDCVVFSRCAGAKVGSGTFKDMKDIWFKDIQVLQGSRGNSVYHQWGTGLVDGVHFVNFDVEKLVYNTYDPYPIQLENNSSGDVRNVEITNVRFKTYGVQNSRIYGYNASNTIDNVTFANLYMAGNLITDLTSGQFSTNSYISGVQFGTVLVAEGFDQNTTGSLPQGWTVSSGTGTSCSVAEVPDVFDKSMKLYDTSSSAYTIAYKAFTPTSNVLTAEWRFKEAISGKLAKFYLRSGSGTVVTNIYTNGSNLVYKDATGVEKVLQAITADQWYTVKIANVNVATDTYDIYVNGSLKVSGASFYTAVSTIDRVQFESSASVSGTTYIDNVRVIQ